MKHRKDQHINNVAPFKNNVIGRCVYTAEMCWWNHNTNQDNLNANIKCFICNESFKSKSDMMAHRKRSHASYIRKCMKFAQNNCSFQSNSCWYLHDEDMETETTNEDENTNTTEQVFRKASVNLKPPINKEKKQKID